MSNFSDFPTIGESHRPILRVEEDLRQLKNNINTLIIDTQKIKSDITEIKVILKEKEEAKNISGGWWVY